ncbi:phosphopantetheine-binding protein [Streptomyces halobius]|uniref:Phosphopantetheine-binding protein n=1 Tax=Streptomyces halobius TaxID=2879846 RepID=A0ABY4LZD7_9ACTN|nr:phosphopantetheine-binding protein [Streptomyces halobius]UQA90864.1 phosphopantetheine-binding protein [Streptomyces halobius]
MYETLALLLVHEFGIAEELVHPQAKARDIELDSLSLAELSVMITQQTGMQIDEEEVSLDSTLEEIAEQFKPADEALSQR